jgi:glycosyltransferase involved in cell wall biosynthesis
MSASKVSVIIPAYNNAEYLGETLQSVLDQTYTNLEVLVVNDASPDNVNEVVQRFSDPRVRYIVHERNQGLSAARNTGIRASTGDHIALLDGDDLFHPKKLELHVAFFDQHPEISVTYNSRFELNHSATTIRELWRPPRVVSLPDLVFGFPFSPSDMVVRREWMFRVNLFETRYVYVGEDMDINCRLAIAGCKFASVDRALNYRRYHTGRVYKDLRWCVDNTLAPLHLIFTDPRCPDQVRVRRDAAIANHYLLWSVIAFNQDATEIGREFCAEAVRLNPAILNGVPSQLLNTLITQSIADENIAHDQLFRRMARQLPVELALPDHMIDWAIARGDLQKATRAMMWNREEAGREHFKNAVAHSAQIDESFLQTLTAQLLDYENEFGAETTQARLHTICVELEKIGGRSPVRWLTGHYYVNQAFLNYHAGNFASVPAQVLRALINAPHHLKNRGVLAILFRSLVARTTRSGGIHN